MPHRTRLCAVSVDLDEIPNYFAIHGLPKPAGPIAHAVYDTALDRFENFSAAHDLPLTLFAVGRDLDRTANAAVLRRLAARGHEVGNHSLDHRYDLTRLPRPEMLRQVSDGADRIGSAVGSRPFGFRAPGYVINDELVEVLRECDVVYDSSVFPCPPYYAAKAAAMGIIALRGRSSRSIVDHPRVLAAPRRPYMLGRPYASRGLGPVELPIQVTRWLRLPFIGTTLTLAGPRTARWLTHLVSGEPLVNLELHGIDLLDESDGLEALVHDQPDVKVPVVSKLATLSEVVGVLRREGYGFVRLDEAARHFGGA